MDNTAPPTLLPIPFANAATVGYRNTIPQASQIAVTPGAASLTDGFPPVTFVPIGAGGIPPYGADFNGILYEITQALRWAQAGAGYVYNAAFSASIGGYPKGSVLQSSTRTKYWISLVDNNTTDPDSGASVGWMLSTASGWTAPSTGTTLTAGARVIPPNETAAVSYLLPAAPSDGDVIEWRQGPTPFNTHTVTFQRNGNTIMGLSEDMSLDAPNQGGSLVWRAATTTWRVFATSISGV